MRLVTFEVESTLARHRRTGALSGERVIDLTAARADQHRRAGRPAAARAANTELPADMLALLELGEPALEAARETVTHAEDHIDDEAPTRTSYLLDEIWLLAPIPRPPSLRDFMVVQEHVRRSFKDDPPAEWWNIPVYYKGNCEEIYGPEDTVPWPAYTEKLDYELEMCAVIGSAGRNVTADRAEELIVGYTIYNDWSARDIQLREMSVGIGPGYGKDFASSIGPAIITADEFDRDASMSARIDGEVWSSSTLGTMHFSFPEIIEWVSREQTLRPGDLLGSGTVGGGCGLELDRWISEGSVVELEVRGIGVLRNYVSARGGGPLRATSDPARKAAASTESSMR
jgi:2-keto-4-pentenoate hydratase/2-oxohepta-3-ene-1,7-dioic acid hydratase in catechol pathway